jgi:indolepyruvate ferredoxin oxidoreductase alpha subunit
MRGRALGIITGGVAYQYAREVFPDASILKLGMTYPLPQKLIRNFAGQVDRLIVMEELDPFLEDQVRLMGVKLWPEQVAYPHTKSIFPLTGELNPAIVRASAIQAGLLPETATSPDATGPEPPASLPAGLKISGNGDLDLPARPPVLCPGCPHRGVFYILHKLKVPVNGDIGCYTLGVVPPLSAIHTTGCMGASIGVAHGAAVAGDKERHVAVIGDSTFFHTGIPALLNVAYNRSNVITIILDNRTTAMTGHQANPGTGQTLQGQETKEVEIEPLVRALGIDRVVTIDAYEVEAIEKTLKQWLKEDGPAVMVAKHPCVLLPEERKKYVPLEVDPNACNGCTICFRIGCPAILKSDQLDPKYHRPLAEIDPLLCTGCEICARVCPRDAITFRDQMVQVHLGS